MAAIWREVGGEKHRGPPKSAYSACFDIILMCWGSEKTLLYIGANAYKIADLSVF